MSDIVIDTAALCSEVDDLRNEVGQLKETAQSWKRIATIYDQFVDGDLTPYDAIQAVGEEVGER